MKGHGGRSYIKRSLVRPLSASMRLGGKGHERAETIDGFLQTCLMRVYRVAHAKGARGTEGHRILAVIDGFPLLTQHGGFGSWGTGYEGMHCGMRCNAVIDGPWEVTKAVYSGRSMRGTKRTE